MGKTKEEIYDEQINPLMSQVIAICKDHNIATLCTFSLDKDEGLACTTALLSDGYEPPSEFLDALRLLRKPASFIAMTITTEPQ